MPKIEIENAEGPGRTTRVDADRFAAMREAYLAVLPADGPGLTPAEIKERLLPLLSAEHFPGGDKAGWWAKAVQLDIEAKGVAVRAPSGPVRLRRR